MEEYLRKVLDQIRCKKARPYIEQELRDHLEDQVCENISQGMDQEKAIDEAVKDMGDPVETGIMLDKVHKPQVAWKLVALVGLISVIGLLIHAMILNQASEDGISYNIVTALSGKYFIFLCLGLITMAVLYWIDYTAIARFSRIIAVFMIAACMVTLSYGLSVNGMICYLLVGGIAVSMQAVMLLYIPVYGGILYKYYGKGYRGVFAAILWMAVPVWLVFLMRSGMTAVLMLVSMMVMLTVALMKGWFKVPKWKAILSVWGAVGVLPGLALAGMYFGNILRIYQKERIRAFFFDGGTASVAENINTDYLLSYLTSTYGLLAGVIVCCVLAALIFYVFSISWKQKNQLGMIMGLGCGMILLASLAMNILANIGAIPKTATFLPFLSAGGSFVIVSYALIGIILSIYRFKNVYPSHMRISAYREKME